MVEGVAMSGCPGEEEGEDAGETSVARNVPDRETSGIFHPSLKLRRSNSYLVEFYENFTRAHLSAFYLHC